MKQNAILAKDTQVPLSLSKKRTFRFLLVLQFWVIFSAAGINLQAQDTRISLNARHSAVRDVLKMIETKSDYHFAYNNKLIDVTRKVDVIETDKPIGDILKKIFANTDVTSTVLDKQIVLASTRAMGEKEAQSSSDNISGKVTDENGQPLPGVSVIVKGTKQATITDTNGNYLINNLPKNAILQFTFVGMLTREVKVGSQSIMNIILQDESKGLSEVIVVGYGTTTKKGLVSTKEQLPILDNFCKVKRLV